MKHLLFLLLLAVSVVIVYAALTGRLERPHSVGFAPAARYHRPPTRPAPTASGGAGPVETVNGIIGSGKKMGKNTAEAFEGLK